MYYLSQLLERKVVDISGRPVGKLQDIFMVPEQGFLLSNHLLVSRFKRGRRELHAVPWEWV
ncbi:MAG: PRC-barrel domain-containing protein, partial [Candidatus Geothermincolales bacterium]